MYAILVTQKEENFPSLYREWNEKAYTTVPWFRKDKAEVVAKVLALQQEFAYRATYQAVEITPIMEG